jgi:site-specific DNA-methyltransferase (cytosine-N4-specific)
MLPPQNQLVLPLLIAISAEGGSISAKYACDAIALKLSLSTEDREKCARTAGGKRYNILDRTVRWTHQIAKLRGLTENDGSGFWRLTESANDKLENARPGVVISVFENDAGIILWSTAEALEGKLDDHSVDLVCTSPPYSLLKCKEYEQKRPESEHIRWLAERAESWKRLLTESGSVMLNLGDVWMPSSPTMALYQERLILDLVDRLGYHLIEKLYWHNPSRLPSPAEYVTVQRIRVTPAIENIWWLSLTENPKADNRNVLVPYSESMKRTLAKGTNAGVRPSGHVVTSDAFQKDNGGAIPHNLLEASNTASNTPYLVRCREAGIKPHPARFPAALPEFAINLTTDPGDVVLDPFGGSLETAETAMRLGRKFIVGERSRHYIDGGLLRFAA